MKHEVSGTKWNINFRRITKMRGYPKFGNRNGCFAAAIAAVIFISCGGAHEAGRIEAPKQSFEKFLATYERTFNPSAFDPSVTIIRTEEQQQHALLESAHLVTTAVPETIPGFRIQVLFTSDIDQANRLRDTISAQLPNDWVYVVYDAPIYKVRVGNFADRGEADYLRRKLISTGYPDAWIVPDNVIKNPPPRLPEEFIVPEGH